MTDKERILTHIVKSFYPIYLLGIIGHKAEMFSNYSEENIQTGDLVISMTSGIHDFTIGYVVKKINNYELTIRKIGSSETYNIENEQFYKIDISNINKNELLEGAQYIVYKKVQEALVDDAFIPFMGSRTYYFGEIHFENKNVTVYLKKRNCEYNKELAPKITFSYEDAESLDSFDIAILIDDLNNK